MDVFHLINIISREQMMRVPTHGHLDHVLANEEDL
jgi:hypothetical protein